MNVLALFSTFFRRSYIPHDKVCSSNSDGGCERDYGFLSLGEDPSSDEDVEAFLTDDDNNGVVESSEGGSDEGSDETSSASPVLLLEKRHRFSWCDEWVERHRHQGSEKRVETKEVEEVKEE
ncbi:hypothetical protein LTS18_003748 [Coniosporium uncinatum]|uniref:Uncharacterized protein n=1 Tax=Coniosporium uncinatum TaxID=93489 RepID=A0ACC3DSU9_9PEZI|nr:hypothetical protein LTS18_003748 [Coniosporium uncinatum]